MNEQYRDFRDLDVWKKCRAIRESIWIMTKSFPQEEKYRLSDQMIRSSRSASNCISEGYGRFHYQENIQFCRQSRGSLFELMDHIIIANECKYISNETCQQSIDEIKNAIRTLNGYIKYLHEAKRKN